ncbi:MAG: helix-turn-helix transcriptional regulator [Bacilli bacterium]|nr:helix-turn-helix transcriptional regulator [Bacilli bacterium]
MDQEKIGNIIRKIRKDNKLTQKQLADKLGVTYQAVSKWENGKNIPDISTLKLISDEFKIDLNLILDGKTNSNNKKIRTILLTITIFVFFFIIYFLLFHKHDFNFKTLSAECENFKIAGSIAYNKDKSTIYISQIEYCGAPDKKVYKNIESILYESSNNINKKISNHKIEDAYITLDEYLQNLSFYIENYNSICKDFIKTELYIELYITDLEEKVITYKIPLNLQKKDCNIKKGT